MSNKKPLSKFILALPLILILSLSAIFAYQLIGDKEDALPSTLIGKAAPIMTLPPLEGIKDINGQPIQGFDSQSLLGKVSLVNIFASWCVPCRIEHPILMDLSNNQKSLQIIGINMRDKPDNALEFLNNLGNPYNAIGVDPNGRAMVEWGGYGVPETFIVDKQGIIQLKHVGPLSTSIVKDKILPLVQSLQ